jgi:UDP-N-acetylglucosamine--N-acetylmuramyl-(pentapeptide) pyrophosphoryl-undecaprenol N-acetylglucosamine transferase
MRYLIAAAGTGGHVFPGLSVGEALVDLGVPRRNIHYVGGDRLEATVYPEEGFPFLGLELRGLHRSLTFENLTLPAVVLRAKRRIEEAIELQDITAVLGMGGYVTVPTALAARKLRVPLYSAEQNAEAGLANRVASRWSDRTFVSFPGTGGLEHGEWVGNPVREAFWSFDRDSLRPHALTRYDLDPDTPVLGVFGGSLGAGVINEAVAVMLESWQSEPLQVVHLTGRAHHDDLVRRSPAGSVVWRRVAFEDAMEHFYAASDLVLARAGGAVAELSATSTPSILIPGRFGSAGHQTGNASFFSEAGAALVLPETDVHRLSVLVDSVIFDEPRLTNMAEDAARIAKPDAARVVAKAMMGREQ